MGEAGGVRSFGDRVQARLGAYVDALRSFLVPDEDLGEHGQVLRIVQIGLAVVGVAVLGFTLWAAFAPLSGAVIAPGFVKIDMNRKSVQHQEGGIVKEIRVRDGQRVAQGQVLIVLEDVRVDASLESTRIQLDAERVKAARLEAESLFKPAMVLPEDLAQRPGDAKLGEVMAREKELFRARREVLESQIALLRRQIRETEKELVATKGQIEAEDKALKFQKEELDANESLLKQNYVANTRVLTLRRAVAEYDAKYNEHQAEAAKADQRISELELRILSMRNTYVQQATDELKESTSKIFDLDEKLRPAKDAAERQKIVAPIAGEVVNLKVFSAGGVVGPRDVLMEIVPDQNTLVIEAHLKPEDINYVREGTMADVRLTAYKKRTTQLVEGMVSYVSADRLTEPQGQAYYMVHVEVLPKALENAGNLKMTAGMPAEVYMRTDSRTAFDYLLAPVTFYFRRAMREPL